MYGYSSKDSDVTRHEALTKAYKAYGGKTLIQKLNALAVLNRNRPLCKIFRADTKWVSEMYDKQKG